MGEGAGIVVLEELRAAQGPRRQDLWRSRRLWPVGRRLPHHRARRGRRWRLPLHGDGDQARRHRRRPTSTTSTPTAPRRLGDEIELRRGRAAARQRRRQGLDVLDQVGDRPSARRRRRRRGDFSLLAMRDNVAPPTINLDNPSVETPIDLVPKVHARSRSTWPCRTRSASASAK